MKKLYIISIYNQRRGIREEGEERERGEGEQRCRKQHPPLYWGAEGGSWGRGGGGQWWAMEVKSGPSRSVGERRDGEEVGLVGVGRGW